MNKRLPTALFFGTVVIGGILLSPFSFMVVFLFFVIVGIWEIFLLFENPSKPRIKVFGIALGVILFGLTFLDAFKGIDQRLFALFIPAFTLLFFFNLYQNAQQKLFAPFINIIGVVYVALPFSLLNYLVFDNSGNYTPYHALALIFIIWANDSFAYFTGSLMGKNKLFESISPGKTWEGFFGGLVAALIMGYVFGVYFNQPIKWITIGFTMSVFGTIGDLVESQMKRLAGKKDSGTILPGHGGVLDRFDALLFTLPFVFAIELFWPV